MTRTVTALCIAAMVGLVTVGRAQQPDTSGRGTLSLTGCLDRTNDGTYQLRNARTSPAGSETTANATGILAGRSRGVRLDDVGRPQAERAAARLASVRLAGIAMQSAFAQGDLVGGIKRGLAQLAEAARKPQTLHA